MADGLKLLHPEILTVNELTALLEKRGIAVSDGNHYSMVETFYRYVLPQPQRKYRENRTGKVLAASQLLINKRKRHNEDTSNEMMIAAKQRKMQPLKKKGLVNNPLAAVVDESKTDGSQKLKINFDKKVIRLSRTQSPTKTVQSDAERKATSVTVNTLKKRSDEVVIKNEPKAKKAKQTITWP